MIKRVKLAAIIAVMVVLLVTIMPTHQAEPPRGAISSSTGLTIERLAALAELTTLRVDVADAIETEVKGYTGTIKAVLIVKGDVTVGVDLSQAKFLSIDEQARRAVLVLPPPRVQSVRLDHEHSKLVGVFSSGLWTITPGGGVAEAFVVNRAFRDGQRDVAKAADDPGLFERARKNTEQVLGCFFAAMAWRVEIRWSG